MSKDVNDFFLEYLIYMTKTNKIQWNKSSEPISVFEELYNSNIKLNSGNYRIVFYRTTKNNEMILYIKDEESLVNTLYCKQYGKQLDYLYKMIIKEYVLDKQYIFYENFITEMVGANMISIKDF